MKLIPLGPKAWRGVESGWRFGSRLILCASSRCPGFQVIKSHTNSSSHRSSSYQLKFGSEQNSENFLRNERETRLQRFQRQERIRASVPCFSRLLQAGHQCSKSQLYALEDIQSTHDVSICIFVHVYLHANHVKMVQRIDISSADKHEDILNDHAAFFMIAYTNTDLRCALPPASIAAGVE